MMGVNDSAVQAPLLFIYESMLQAKSKFHSHKLEIMGFHSVPLVALLCLAVVGSCYASMPAELHWKSVFPNTPMPKSLQDLLSPVNKNNLVKLEDDTDALVNNKNYGRSNAVNNFFKLEDDTDALADNKNYVRSNLSADYVHSNLSAESRKDDTDALADNKNYVRSNLSADYIRSNLSAESRKDDTDALADNKNYVRSNLSAESRNTDFEDSNRNHELKKGSHLTSNASITSNVSITSNASITSNVSITSNASIFFLESDLHPGRLMKLPGLAKTQNRATFLPRAVADSMPFSSSEFSDILKLFSMGPKSVGAKVMKQNVENCERAATEGEDKYCATSLESLIDLSVSRLGKNIQVLSTKVEKETKNEEFTIGEGATNMGEKNIVCHKMKYPYAVFLCYSIDKTDVYRVPLVGSDGTKVKATAVCHKDTSAWNPRHLAFQLLKVKPGSVPICHFLEKDTIVWVPNRSCETSAQGLSVSEC